MLSVPLPESTPKRHLRSAGPGQQLLHSTCDVWQVKDYAQNYLGHRSWKLLSTTPILEILELLKEDEVMFVKRSVANHLTDWLKVNPSAVRSLIERWKTSSNKHTQWIIKRATRKIS